MDLWDILLVKTVAANRPVILFDNAGVGKSDGKVPNTINEMAQHVLNFLEAIDETKIDLLGFNLGGYIAQLATLNARDIPRRLTIAGSGPSYGEEAPGHPTLRQSEVGQIAAIRNQLRQRLQQALLLSIRDVTGRRTCLVGPCT